MTAAELRRINREIDDAISQSATERAEVGFRLNTLLKARPVTPTTARLRACVLTCLLGIPAGGPLHIPTCTRHQS